MTNKCKILIAYHKESQIIKSDIYVPIQVGRDVVMEKSKDGKISQKSMNWLLNNLIGDNTGDNISKLNRYFNEMSAIYWAWKNQDKLDNPEYIGLMHYRRHFIFSENNTSKYTWLDNSSVYSYEFIDKKYMEMLDEKYIKNLIEQYDIITTQTYNANNLNDGHYYFNSKERFVNIAKVSGKWYDKMDNIIREKYPEYITELDNLNKAADHYLCNMFIMKKELFNKYCEFVFGVLIPIYKEFKNEKNNIWQERAIGFLAEFLTSIFIATYKVKNPLNVKELDLTYVENPENKSIYNKIKDFIFSKRKYKNYKSITILGINRIKTRKNNNNIFIKIMQQNDKIIKLLENR